jgi:membrane-associated phospholipid phosphatase
MYKAAMALFIAFIISFPARATDYFEVAGDIGQYALPAAALGAALWQKDWKGCFQLGAAYAATLGVSYALKYSIKQTRPDGGAQSFPSGHTSSAFCGASFLAVRYGPAWGIPACAAATLVGWSRIEADRHFPEDVVVGAAIGIISNIIITRSKTKRLALAPVAGNGTYGAVVLYQW